MFYRTPHPQIRVGRGDADSPEAVAGIAVVAGKAVALAVAEPADMLQVAAIAPAGAGMS